VTPEPFYGLDPDPVAPALEALPDDLAEASKEWLATALVAERSHREDLDSKLDEVYAREKILVEGLSDEQNRRKEAEAKLEERKASGPVEVGPGTVRRFLEKDLGSLDKEKATALAWAYEVVLGRLDVLEGLKR
jgi:hypothetical protein